jgi:cyclin H
MFPSGTQMKFWTFHSQSELDQLRKEANHKYIRAHYDGDMEVDDPLRNEFFLNMAEECTVRQYYEDALLKFCREFRPSMPAYVMGTAVAYYKRFFLHNSVMDYHPKDIMYPCVYLACKVEEFNVTIGQFVANMSLFEPDEAVDLVLSQELLLMQMLHYHLTVHNPYRPVEGLLIDIKTRSDITDPERLRKGADEFIFRSLRTDICLLFSPSQIALAALLTGGNMIGVSLDSYVANKLLEAGNREQLMKLIERVKAVRSLVRGMESVNVNDLEMLEEKLERCRNHENNPLSELYRQRLDDLLDEDDTRRADKRIRLAAEDAMDEDDEDPLVVQSIA